MIISHQQDDSWCSQDGYVGTWSSLILTTERFSNFTCGRCWMIRLPSTFNWRKTKTSNTWDPNINPNCNHYRHRILTRWRMMTLLESKMPESRLWKLLPKNFNSHTSVEPFKIPFSINFRIRLSVYCVGSKSNDMYVSIWLENICISVSMIQ